MCIFFLTTTILTHENEHKESEYYKIINNDELILDEINHIKNAFYDIINNTHKIKRSDELLSKE